jgi:uncharacterized membrane protein
MWAFIKKYLVAGLLTAIPIWITWLVVSFIFRLVVNAGQSVALRLTQAIAPAYPKLADWILKPYVRDLVAVAVVLVFLIFLGWLATKVFGRKLINLFENLIKKIPLVKSVYGGSKKLIESFQRHPDESTRVVLINYPSPEMKTVGLLMRFITDKETQKRLAAVYVPTTPNPTSGFLEIVPEENITLTDWSVNEAVSFIVSGATLGPDSVNFSKSHIKSSPDATEP